MKDLLYQKVDISLIYLYYIVLFFNLKVLKFWIFGNILQRQLIIESRGRMLGNILLIQFRGSSNRALMMWNIMVFVGELYRIFGKEIVKFIV